MNKKQIPITVSPALLRKEPSQEMGMGYVNASLLLWLESSEKDDETNTYRTL